MKRQVKHERGVVLAMAGLWLVAMSAIAAIAIGVSRLTDTATEVQTVADAGALSGASALLAGKSAYTVAENVAQANQIDGKHAAFDAADIVTGYYNPTSHQFVAGGTPQDAVQATAHATVTTLWAAIFGGTTAPVTKQAVATYTPRSNNSTPGTPTLPAAVGACFFTNFQTTGACSDLPTLTQVPNPTNNSGWTSLQTGVQANKGNISPFLPTVCGCAAGACAGGQQAPLVTTGEQTGVGVQNGQEAALLQLLAQCVANGVTKWVVPVVACGTFNGDMTVLGYATVTISSVVATGSPKGINMTSICNTTTPGPPTNNNFGSGQVALAQ
jgi:hypothetical protein